MNTVIVLSVVVVFCYSWSQFSYWGKKKAGPDFIQDYLEINEFSPYVTTALKYNLFAFFYAGLMSLGFSGLLLSIWYLLDSPFFITAPLWLCMLVLILYPQLSRTGSDRMSLRFEMQRYCFDPVLPSRAEELILCQLVNYEACFQPSNVTLQGLLSEELAESVHAKPVTIKERLLYKLAKISYLVNVLEKSKEQSCFRFGNKIIVSNLPLLKVIREKLAAAINNMPSETEDKHLQALKIADSLLIRCYQVVTRVILKNHLSREARLAAFGDFGLVVNVEEALLFRWWQDCLYTLHLLLPGRAKKSLKDRSDRRRSRRIFCYRPGRINLGSDQLICRSAVLSTSGAAVPGHTDQPVGTPLTYYLDGFGHMDAVLVRKNDKELFLAFKTNDSLKRQFSDYLDSYLSFAFN